jgi:hypothetical protein
MVSMPGVIYSDVSVTATPSWKPLLGAGQGLALGCLQACITSMAQHTLPRRRLPARRQGAAASSSARATRNAPSKVPLKQAYHDLPFALRATAPAVEADALLDEERLAANSQASTSSQQVCSYVQPALPFGS